MSLWLRSVKCLGDAPSILREISDNSLIIFAVSVYSPSIPREVFVLSEGLFQAFSETIWTFIAHNLREVFEGFSKYFLGTLRARDRAVSRHSPNLQS